MSEIKMKLKVVSDLEKCSNKGKQHQHKFCFAVSKLITSFPNNGITKGIPREITCLLYTRYTSEATSLIKVLAAISLLFRQRSILNQHADKSRCLNNMIREEGKGITSNRTTARQLWFRRSSSKAMVLNHLSHPLHC